MEPMNVRECQGNVGDLWLAPAAHHPLPGGCEGRVGEGGQGGASSGCWRSVSPTWCRACSTSFSTPTPSVPRDCFSHARPDLLAQDHRHRRLLEHASGRLVGHRLGGGGRALGIRVVLSGLGWASNASTTTGSTSPTTTRRSHSLRASTTASAGFRRSYSATSRFCPTRRTPSWRRPWGSTPRRRWTTTTSSWSAAARRA